MFCVPIRACEASVRFMTKEELTIELVEPDEGSWGRAPLATVGAGAVQTSLHSERMGLLARTSTKSPHDDRRMEDWIASHLDLGEPGAPGPRSPWAQIIEKLPGLKKKPKNKAREQSGAIALDSWKRFQVAYK